ncbi:unnamed protein product [Mytilus edulis]|uniref:CCHC-type domain-containing protein n=1 Tax=Mytilus edulis TaxID=6550 RepID=A0A8S3SUV5_MYTED|nr:unnamed protein product [Mytilus edulis]
MDTNGPLVGYSGCQSLRTPAAPSSANGQLQARRIRRYSLQRPSNSESITEYRLIFSTMSGFKIKINSSPESVLLHVPGIGTATARRIIVMRNNGITITPEILAQIPYMKNKMSLVSDMIDFSPCEFNDMDNVDVRYQGQPHESQDYETDTHVKSHEGGAANFVSTPFTPGTIRREIAHLQEFNTDTQRWIDQHGSTQAPVQGGEIYQKPYLNQPVFSDSEIAMDTVWNSQVDRTSMRSMPSCIEENEYPTQEMDRCRIFDDNLSCSEESLLPSRTLQPEVIDPAYGPHYVEYEPSDKPDLPSLDRSMSIQHDSTTMIEVQLNQQPRLVGEHCTEYESSTAMKEQHFENTHLNDRFQQSQTGNNQSAQSPPTVANQPINHRATGQQPPQPNINRSNPLPALRSTPPVREREPYQQLPPTANRANQPPCPRSTGQLQSTRQQNYTFPVGTAGQQNRVIDNQQHQPPISHPVNIPHINSHVPPTQQFNRTGLYQPNTNQSGFQQPLNNTMGQQGQPPQAIHNQQEVYRQQPVQHLQNVTAPIHQTQQPFGNIPYQQGRPYQPSTAPNLVQGMTQSGIMTQIGTSMSSITSCSNSDSDSSSSTSGVVYRRSRHKSSRSNKTHSRLSISSRHVSPVEEEASEHSSPHRKNSGKKHDKRRSDRHGQSETDGHHSSSNRHRAKPAPMKQDKKFFFSVPKNLKYTGKGNWKAFYTKFTGYAEAAGWTDKQKREQLCWCLEDKASDFYTVLLESNKDIAFSTVVTKMVKRFGFQEPQETSQIQFQTITQKTEESLADWADRVLSLATQSFKDLSEEYMTKQAVMKFCQGCNDPEAGQHACGFKPVSVENAIDIIKWYQHSRKAVQAHIAQGKTHEVKQASAPTPTAQVSDTPSVHGVGSSKPNIDTRVSQMEQQLRQQREEQQQSMQQMQSLLSSMATLTEEMRHSNRSSGTSPSRDYRSDNTSRGRGQGRRGGYNNRAGNRRSQTPDGACFYCHELGHFKRDCPKLNNSPGSKPPTQNKQTERKSVTMKLPEDQATEGPSNGFTVVGTIGTAQLLRVQVKIQDKLVTALIDTGSEVTIMQDKVFDSLKRKTLCH